MTDTESKQAEPTTKKCVSCRCIYALRFYSNNPKTDIQYKTCDPCRERVKVRQKGYDQKRKKIKCDREGCNFEGRKHVVEAHIKAIHNKIKDNGCPFEDCDYKSSELHHLKNHIKEIGRAHV